MRSLDSKKVILWDFDGVIIESNTVRVYGFEAIFKDFPKKDIEALLDYHNRNGGLSRYVKIRYFFEEIRGEEISDEEVQTYADAFSEIMRIELTKKKYLIQETVQFLESNKNKYQMHIVSGSDGKELNYLCNQLEVAKYFITINGSPVHKNQLVANIMSEYKYPINEVILIGDSINDYEAAIANNIEFAGYNNSSLEKYDNYIKKFIC